MLSSTVSTYVLSALFLSTFTPVTASPHLNSRAGHGFVKMIKREVPQEHSHEQFITTVRASLQESNPRGIKDPIFGLLGNAAAAGGANGIDVACLQQATADQAFTNAKSKNDVAGMTAALVYRALERNTPGVGKASAACTSEVAKNKEIAALRQHQDPASPNAAVLNKATTLALAVQINSVGGDSAVALKSGAFAPGNLGDNSGKGNTCDDQNDAAGCIFTQNKLVQDATLAEIEAAVGGKNSVASASTTSTTTVSSTQVTAAATTTLSATRVTVTVQPTNCPALTLSATLTSTTPTPTDFAAPGEDCIDGAGSTILASTVTSSASGTATATSTASISISQASIASVVTVTSTVTVSATDCAATSSPTSASSTTTSSSSANLQTFTGALGGIVAPAVTVGGRGFVVDGEPNSSDLRKAAALQRSCSIQHNKCADAANSGGGFSVGDCDTQNNACQAA